MNRIELYIDSAERLTIDFFQSEKSETYLARKKGAECYSTISEICSRPVNSVRFSPTNKDFFVFFDDCFIHVNESERVIGRRGTAPVFKAANNFLEKEKRKEIEKKKSVSSNELPKPLKVTRKNKHIGKKIIASSIVMTLLLSTLIYKSKQQITPEEYEIEPTSATQIEEQEPTFIAELTYENSESKSSEVQVLVHEEISPNLEIVISYEDRSNTEKAQITRAYYGDTIEKYAKMYGLDPKIVIAIATQERGVHSDKMDPGGATGLMQIQNEVWVGETLTAYNVKTKQHESVLVTKEDLSDVFKNIRYGCMIYQNCLDYMNGNVLAAIQCYNMGYGNMSKIFKSYSLETGKSTTEILNDITDNGWLQHRNIINVGDQNYIEHVLSWIGPEIDIGVLDQKSDSTPITIINESKVKSIS